MAPSPKSPNDDAPAYTTHPRVVAGVTLIASLMLFSTLAVVAFIVINLIAPPQGDALADYMTSGRAMFVLAIATFGTGLFWVSVNDPD